MTNSVFKWIQTNLRLVEEFFFCVLVCLQLDLPLTTDYLNLCSYVARQTLIEKTCPSKHWLASSCGSGGSNFCQNVSACLNIFQDVVTCVRRQTTMLLASIQQLCFCWIPALNQVQAVRINLLNQLRCRSEEKSARETYFTTLTKYSPNKVDNVQTHRLKLS